MRRSLALSALAVLGAACTGGGPAPGGSSPAPAAAAPTGGPAYVDAYQTATPVRAGRPDLATGQVTSIDSQQGVPRFVWGRHDQRPPATATATSGGRARGATSPAATAALWHLDRNAAAYGLDAAALATVYVRRIDDLGHGPIVVELGQRVGGLEVYRTKLSVFMARDLSLVALSGSLAPTARAAAAPSAFRLDPTAAIGRAVTDATGAAPTLALPAGARAGYQLVAAPGLTRPARARRVLFPVPGRLVPAWATEVAWRDHGRLRDYRHVVADDDGRVLLRGDRTASDFQYRVFADPTAPNRPLDGPVADATPHPTGSPDGFTPAFVAPVLVTMDGFNSAPGGGHDPWLDPGATTTAGNNVVAYADLDGIDHQSAGDIQPDVTAPGVFDRTYDTAADPKVSTDQTKAAVTQMFYVTNWLHDFWYDSGLDEAAGVAQVSNHGRGGAEGDPLHAEGQDSSGLDNANMDTPDDGVSPTMQMYIFDAPSSDHVRRDGTIDDMVVEHEYGHYIHLRLVDCSSPECYAMSEGFADFDALLTTVRAGDDLHGTFAMGVYSTQGLTQNSAYFGIRRFPYSIDTSRNALTFRHMQDGVALPSVPMDNVFAGPNYESHDAGEVWCSMLWEGLVALLEESQGSSPPYTFEEARRRMADYLIAGMKGAPVEPTFTEQRDAILAAAAAADHDDFVVLAQAYARRGFGTTAVSPPLTSNSGNGIVESFDAGGQIVVRSASLAEDAGACDDDGILDVGETGVLTVTIEDVGPGDLAAATVAVTSTTEGVAFPSGAQASFPAIASGATGTATIPIRLDEGSGLPSHLALTLTVTDPGAAPVVRPTGFRINADPTGTGGQSDDVEAPTTVWTVDGTRWTRADSPEAQSTVWTVPDVGVVTDERLVSPPLQVSAASPLTISFRQRYSFDTSLYVDPDTGQPIPNKYDGGVLEISDDGGATWQDVSAFGNPGYGDPLVAGTDDPLAGCAAWTGQNPGYPAFAPQTVSLGTAFAGKTVQVRFRFGSNSHWASGAWELDDLAFGGIDNAPFPVLVPDTGACLPGARPIADAGTDQSLMGGQTVTLDGTGSVDPDGGALTYAWTQTLGFHVTLDDPTAAQPSFDAPPVSAFRTLRFELVVRDPDNRVSLPDTVTVLLAPEPADAGVDAMPDASTAPDASTGPDAAGAPDATTAAPDAGTSTPPGGGGCGGCAAPGGAGAGDALVLLGLGWILRRRRRR
jgi:Fungalysin metallopeptidase (M36)/K319L-like, PKD domain